jgi:hypothetical protein
MKHLKGRTQAEGVWEQENEQNIQGEGDRSEKTKDKTSIMRSLKNYTLHLIIITIIKCRLMKLEDEKTRNNLTYSL